MAKAWTTHEVKTLRETLAAGGSLLDAAALIGRPYGGVRLKAQSLGLAMDRSTLARIKRFCVISAEDEDACWIWSGYVRTGTPMINIDGKPQSARRAAMKAAGLWRKSFRFATSRCGRMDCVRAEHGKGATGAEHMEALWASGRLGTALHRAASAQSVRQRAILTLPLVRELRARHAAGEPIEALMADANGAKLDTLRKALQGRTWAEVTSGASVFSLRATVPRRHPGDWLRR